MKTYNFIKISNNKNAARDFIVDFTTMRDCKLRMQILKSQLKLHKRTGRGIYRPAWIYIDLYDYSYYKIASADFATHVEAKQFAIELYNAEFAKLNLDKINDVNTIAKNIVSFK